MPLTPALLKTMDSAAFKASGDTQLQRAVEWLTCPSGSCAGGAAKTPGN
jgi:hypothetical protein